MLRLFPLLTAAILLSACQQAEEQNPERDFDESSFVSSNLPLIVVQTNGVPIPDEPKVLTRMTIINQGSENVLSDTTHLDYGYDEAHLYAGVELRGSGSQAYAKKQYSVELWQARSGTSLYGYDIGTTKDALKNDSVLADQEAELLGMPAEEDWILNAPYSDKSLMRNVLAYSLAADITGRWQPKTRFTELFFRDADGKLDYRGVYVLIEKIKRDSNRVDLNKLKKDEISGEDLTGGYLLELTTRDRLNSGDVWIEVGDHVLAVEYPKAGDLQPEQAAYIRNYMSTFASALYADDADDDTSGYSAYADLDSLIDFLLINEVFKNRDAFYASTYFYKDKNKKLVAGPVWDFNLSSGNDTHLKDVDVSPSGWFYTGKWLASGLYRSPKFIAGLQQRWQELRTGVLADDAINSRIDQCSGELNQGAASRNFEKWDILGKFIDGNQIPDSQSHAEEVEYLRRWLLRRLEWIDSHISSLSA